MESGKNPGDEKDKRRERGSPQKSKGQPKTIPNLMIKIPAEFLSERQKKVLGQKPRLKDEPSTSSEKKDDVFKVPWIPPLKKKESSPSKTSDVASTSSSTALVDMAQDANLNESVAQKTVKDASLDESVPLETVKDANLDEPTAPKTVKDVTLDESVAPERVKDESLGEDIKSKTHGHRLI